MEKSINSILVKIQTELIAPKNQFNKFGNYKYRSCEDILEALKPILKEANSSVIITDKIVLVGNRYYVEATARLTADVGEATAVAYARESEDRKGMDLAQITGATSSYARKHALNGLFCIDDTKDTDSNNKGVDSVSIKKKEDSLSSKVALTVRQALLKKQGEVFNLLCQLHDTKERQTKNKKNVTDYYATDTDSTTKIIITKWGKTHEGLKQKDFVMFKDVKVGTFQGKLTYLAKDIEKVGK